MIINNLNVNYIFEPVANAPTVLFLHGWGAPFEIYKPLLDYIRSKACDGIGVDDVVKFLSMSRRSAERAFRRFFGRTILEEISDVRYQKACCLLKDTTRTLDGIYAECGYRDNISFRRFFRNKAGVSLGEWRKRHS